MTDACDLCRSEALEFAYAPDGSTRGLKIYICSRCGLVQSLPRADRAPRRVAAVSSGADWGNVRYGKGFRTAACLSLLRMHADMRANLQVLDVGSNRGSFAQAMLDAAPNAILTCVEPDERVAQSCADLEGTYLIEARIEEVGFQPESFDVIHSCHTIEHLASPAATLADHWRSLKPGGLLILDAPNIALIGSDDVVEEWFIDKHLYHFSARTLTTLLKRTGFEIVTGPNPNDRENLLFAARKLATPATGAFRADAGEAEAARALIRRYRATRAANLTALADVAATIAGFAPKRVALWGAGRLFDALVLHGGFDPKSLVLLIDSFLKSHVSERHGVPLCGPEALYDADPQVIVVMSRAFAPDIARIAKARAPRAEIVLYGDLIARARLATAA